MILSLLGSNWLGTQFYYWIEVTNDSDEVITGPNLYIRIESIEVPSGIVVKDPALTIVELDCIFPRQTLRFNYRIEPRGYELMYSGGVYKINLGIVKELECWYDMLVLELELEEG